MPENQVFGQAGGGYSVYAVSTVLSNEIWFVLGMSVCSFNVQLKAEEYKER